MRWCVNKISICGVAVISNLTVCDGDGVSSTFLAVMPCSLTFFAVLRCCGVRASSPPPLHHIPLSKCIENRIDKIALQRNTHTCISNNNGAFASVVNGCERTRDLSSLFFKASYTFIWKVSCYFEYCCKAFDLQESRYMTSNPARTFMHSDTPHTNNID